MTFASIDIGSYEIEMKIFEMTSKNGMKEIDDIRYRLDIGKDTFRTGKIGREVLDELCGVLEGFNRSMQEYKVTAYQACTTSAIREAKNMLNVLDQIKLRTGLKVDVLSNSEQRFLGYKAIAAKENDFNKIIQKGTAIVDLGGGSLQLSVFDKDSLVTTQNIKWGFVRIHQILSELERKTTHYPKLIEELIDPDIRTMKKYYFKDRKIENIIAVGDYIDYMVRKNNSVNQNFMTKDRFMELYDQLIHMTPDQIADYLQIGTENAIYVIPSAVVYKQMLLETGAELIWTPGITLSDGIAYDYAVKRKYVKPKHNFENDILAAAQNMAKRYQSSKSHTTDVQHIANIIFDSMKKVHGLGKREKLLLQIAAILHDCGKYISMQNIAACSYDIIMATEIIGLSHMERVIIANIVRYHREQFQYYKEDGSLSEEQYLMVEKLTAILRIANSLGKGSKQKYESLKAMFREGQLLLTVWSEEDLLLEMEMFRKAADFFEEVYNVRPVLKQKKHF